MPQFESWGRYPRVKPAKVISVNSTSDLPNLQQEKNSVLPYAMGRSYGDSCLNEGNTLLDVNNLKNYLAFDEQTGLLRCEAGVTLAEILELAVPRGWFLPVSPGTKYVSVGGAIANDIHGKNHHRGGTFGCHVTQLELVRSNGKRYICSPAQNIELFEATIGGLGLTGLITWAEFKLKKIYNAYIDVENIRFDNLAQFFEISRESDHDYEYTVSWIDCLAQGKSLGRGIFMRGNSNQSRYRSSLAINRKLPLSVPLDAPSFLLNPLTMKAFNFAYYNKQFKRTTSGTIPYDPFFYPLDAVSKWNKLYGGKGFLQYQLIVPFDQNDAAIREVLERISRAGEGSFLAVLKTFGNVKSPGMLSFPQPGVTLALDFPFYGAKTLRLLDELDEVVSQSRGRVYPAKDARMSSESFKQYFPNWREFASYIDPKFSSSFWRRVVPEWNTLQGAGSINRNEGIEN